MPKNSIKPLNVAQPTAKKPTVTATNKIAVTFVCTGNTCRSPMAEMIFKDLVAKSGKKESYIIKSAGLYPNVGEPMAENARLVLKEMNIKAPKRTSKLLTLKLAKKSDLIICMTAEMKRELSGIKTKVLSVADITGGNDVGDPYGQSLEVYKKVAEYLLYACGDILRKFNS